MALLGGGSGREKEFAEFLDARNESYFKLVNKYNVKPVDNIHYIRTSRDRFLIHEEDMQRLLKMWTDCNKAD